MCTLPGMKTNRQQRVQILLEENAYEIKSGLKKNSDTA